MNHLYLLLLVLFCAIHSHTADSTQAQSVQSKQAQSVQSKRAVWIKLEDMVDPGMNDYVSRAISQAKQQKPDIIVFEINTFGGRLDAAFDIVDTITAIRDIETVALVRLKAISAGALIALANQRLFMMPSTTIGDCAPITQSQEGPQILGEKIQSPLRAKFRNLAQRNGYPELLSEAMVTPELEVIEITNGDSTWIVDAQTWEDLGEDAKDNYTRRTIVKAGELLTMTDVEAKDLGFSEATVNDAEELKKLLGITEVVSVDISWAESLARSIGMIAPLLLLVGFGALYLEFQAPGFGVFGIVGILALATVFGGQYLSDLHDKLPLVLLLLGMALIMTEIIFLPGTWFLGISGTALMMAALVMVLRDAQLPSYMPEIPALGGKTWAPAALLVIGSALIALVVPFAAAKWLLPALPQGYSPILSADLADSHAPEVVNSIQVGDKGITVTPLRPSGKARFGEVSVEVVARDEFIDAKQSVRVVSLEATHAKVVKDIS